MVPGYCTECHRIKPVRVSGAGINQLAMKRTATGICTRCASKPAKPTIILTVYVPAHSSPLRSTVLPGSALVGSEKR